jgi:CCR4-NOT transcriptional regulation complex NOT5 subunit
MTQQKKRNLALEVLEDTTVIKQEVSELMSLLDPKEADDEDPVQEIKDLLIELTTDIKLIKAHLGIRQ